MSKIICDICGTTYPETAEQCPICGCARDFSVESLTDELAEEEVVETPARKGGRFAAAAGRKRAPVYDEDEYDDDDEDEDDEDEYDDEYDEDDEEEEEHKSNAPLVILLVVVIMALIAVSAFIFVKYYMPNMMPQETTEATTEATTVPTETTEPTVPCENLALTSGGEIVLDGVGANWLINVMALPENTTDEIIYTSSDEAVAIVNEQGKVTAVGEGTAVITITCGEQELTCAVTCEFVEETTVPETTVPETTVPETTVPETTLPDVEISFVKDDVTSRMIGEQFYLRVNPSDLDGDLLTWSSENEGICTVDQEGLVTITGRGTTHVYVEYNGQKIECIVRVY